MPQGVSLVYPAQPTKPLAMNGVDLSTPSVVALEPHVVDFGGLATPAGPGAAPAGKGSIKAARVVNHGICSTELPYVTGDALHPGLLEQLDATFFFGLIDAVRGIDGCTDVIRNDSHWTPFLREPEDKEDGQHGGFIFDGHYALRGHATDTIGIRTWYTLRLQDGLLSADATSEGTSVVGSFNTLVKPILETALIGPAGIIPQGARPSTGQSTLPGKLLESAWALQEYHGLDLTADQSQIFQECHQDTQALIFGGNVDSVPVTRSIRATRSTRAILAWTS